MVKKSATFSIRLDHEDYLVVKKLSETTGISIAAVVRTLVKQQLRDKDGKLN